MELMQWANGKGYTLKADSKAEFELLKGNLDYCIKYGALLSEVEVDETNLADIESSKEDV